MKSYFTFRQHPLDQVVPPTNDDHHPAEIVPFGLFGAGLWTGHPIGLFIVVGMMLIALVGIPEWRWFFAASVTFGSLVAYLLWRYHEQKWACLMK